MVRFLAGLLFLFACQVQAWPEKPVRIIVPFAPGGSADTLGRLVAQKLSEHLKAGFVIENRAGAGGALGSELAAKAAPDGYTLVVSGIASHVIAPLLPQGTPYDPVRDFTHIALFGGPPAVLAVNPSLEAKDLREFVNLAKTRPLSYGSPGNGTQGQLVAELFKRRAGIELQHVPYKGASGAVTDLIAGHIPVVSTTLTTAASQIRAGRARGLAISAPMRLADFPGIPTFAELGYPDLVATVWFSLSGPANLPADIVERLNAEVNRALDPQVSAHHSVHVAEVRDDMIGAGIHRDDVIGAQVLGDQGTVGVAGAGVEPAANRRERRVAFGAGRVAGNVLGEQLQHERQPRARRAEQPRQVDCGEPAASYDQRSDEVGRGVGGIGADACGRGRIHRLHFALYDIKMQSAGPDPTHFCATGRVRFSNSLKRSR